MTYSPRTVIAHVLTFALPCLFFPAWQCAGSEKEAALAAIRKHLKPLTHPLGDHLPLITWQNGNLPMGFEGGNIEAVQQVFLDRGFLPTCNRCSSAAGAKQYLPVLKYWQKQGFPVCILPQGWVQKAFLVARNGKYKCAHKPPASIEHAYPCPAVMLDPRRAEREARSYRATLRLLKDNDIDIKMLLIDYESGAYLRNTADRESKVLEQIAMARQCPACLKTFGEERLAGPAEYVSVVNEARAYSTREMLAEPLREIFPNAHLGNFYAWPIGRVPRPEGRWPAYGFDGSGMNIAMPRVYMNAGWGGAGRGQEKMNWNALYCCLEGFSPSASVLKEGELLIPWTHIWLGGRYIDFIMKRQKVVPEVWAMSEMARHMMLRGAETFAIWIDAQMGAYPEGYPFPQYAEMGQFVYDVKGVQEGFNDMLQFDEFLRRAKPMTFEVFGEKAKLGPATATWSGMQTPEKALVRTIVFDHGKSMSKTIKAYDRQVKLTFGPKGRNYWVYPDGRVEPL